MPKNTFTGEFSSPEKEKEFLNLTIEVQKGQFKNEIGLMSINMPKVEKIGKYAFENVPLISIVMPDVIEIEEQAFLYAMTKILELPKVKRIGDLAFSRNNNLEKLVLPEVEYIGHYAF